MLELPRSNATLLVRTDFTSDVDWQRVCEEAAAESGEGFQATFVPISDPQFDRAEWCTVKDAVPANPHRAAVLFIADSVTLADREHPILIVGLRDDDGEPPPPPFRCVPSELWGVENNLNIANMDWSDFADAVDPDGVFRGFPDHADRTPAASQLEVRGLAAAHRLVRDMTHGHRARTISGHRERIRVARILQAAQPRAYEMASKVSFWITHSARAFPIHAGGRFEFSSSRDFDSRMGMFGYLAIIDGEYQTLDEPHTVEVSWYWHPPRPSTALSEPTPSFLPWPTIVRFDIEPAAATAQASSKETRTDPDETRVTVSHIDVPTEWAQDLIDFWAWNLEHMQATMDLTDRLARRHGRA